MKEGYIIINSESRINYANDNITNAYYNLKYVNLDLNKKYEIALCSAYLIADPEGVGTRLSCESLLDQLYIIESDIVKAHDYSSMTSLHAKNFNTRRILTVLNTASGPNVATTGDVQCIKSLSTDNFTYQEIDLSNFSYINIILKDTDDQPVREPADEIAAMTASLTNYTFVFKYREIITN